MPAFSGHLSPLSEELRQAVIFTQTCTCCRRYGIQEKTRISQREKHSQDLRMDGYRRFSVLFRVAYDCRVIDSELFAYKSARERFRSRAIRLAFQFGANDLAFF
jgi:hypothetical protein